MPSAAPSFSPSPPRRAARPPWTRARPPTTAASSPSTPAAAPRGHGGAFPPPPRRAAPPPWTRARPPTTAASSPSPPAAAPGGPGGAIPPPPRQAAPPPSWTRTRPRTTAASSPSPPSFLSATPLRRRLALLLYRIPRRIKGTIRKCPFQFVFPRACGDDGREGPSQGVARRRSDLDRLASQRAAFVYGVSAFPQGEEDASFFGSRMAGQGSAKRRRSCDGSCGGRRRR